MSDNKNKSKYLFKNIGILTIAQFGSKFISFLLVPLYTNILTTEEYGIYELAYTTITLLIPFVTLNIAESTIRFSLDENEDKKKVFTISIKYLLIGTTIVAGLLVINNVFNIVKISKYLVFLIFVIYIVQSLGSVLSGFARGLDKVADMAISGVLSSGVIVLSNILFLVIFKWGLIGYFLANCFGPLVQCIYLWYRVNCKNYILKYPFGIDIEREMISYSKPMIANATAWWINSASDRFIVTFFCGVAVNGIYSIGYKIPSILAAFTNLFNSAWTLSAVRDYDSNDQDGFFTKMYSLYNYVVTLVCSVILVLSRFFASLLFAKDFYDCWIYIPWLLMSNLFCALAGYIGGIFSAVKDTKMFAKSTVIGAIINILLNILLVRYIGALGAALSTLISYIAIWVIRYKGVIKYIKMKIKLVRDIVAYTLLLIQGLLLLAFRDENLSLYLLEFTIFIIILLLFRDESCVVYSIIYDKHQRYKGLK